MEERLSERPQSGKRIILLASEGVLYWMKLTLMRASASLGGSREEMKRTNRKSEFSRSVCGIGLNTE